MDYEQQVRSFFAAWGKSFDEMCGAIEANFGPDCRWDQRPMLLTTGIPPAVRFFKRCRRMTGLETIDVEILRLVAQGDLVLCERVDHLRRRNGSLIASAPVAGVLELKDGKIVYWREYFDITIFAKDAALKGLSGLTAWLRGAGKR